MRTRIQLITGENLELSEDIAFSLNFSIADIREPDKRDSNYSKTISIPASKIANKFFKSAFEIDGYDNYNTNHKVGATIYIDGLEQIVGYLQLIKISREDKKYFYDVTIKGNITNVFSVWGDRFLSELDLSKYNHDYSKSNIQQSWINIVKVSGVNTSVSMGEGYVYPMIDYGKTNGLTFGVDNFYPAIYAKQYIDSIFKLAGFTYSSNFFDTDYFRRLIIPYNATTLALTTAQIEPMLFDVSLGANIVLSDFTTPNDSYVVPYNTIINDPSNQYDETTTHKATITQGGQYIFSAKFNFEIEYLTTNAAFNLIADITTLCIIRNNNVIATKNYLTYNSTLVNNITFTLTSPAVTVNSGDIVYAKIIREKKIWTTFTGSPFTTYTSGYSSTYNQHLKLTVKIGCELSDQVVNTEIFEGNTIPLSYCIPQKVKIKDFFKSIVQMFNLFIETDKNITNHLLIEPRNDFYNAGQVIDWTSKLAIDKPIDITPMGELNAIEYRYQYKSDKDYFNFKYETSYQEPFGTQRTIIDNDFLKNVNLTEVIFSPTPLSRIGTTDRIISQIVAIEKNGGVSDIKTCNIRILYYGGLLTTANTWSFTSILSGNSNNSTYPYAGHLDVPLLPTLDLSFGVPKEDYYTTQFYTDNCLYNRFYKSYIQEITDKDSKLVTAYLNLTPYDIYTLDFRNKFKLDRSILRLNKIYDYNPVQRGLTKVEFIKVKEATTFVPQNKQSVGGVDDKFDDGTPLPSFRGFNAVHASNFIAENNIVDTTARGCIITGENNFIGEGCKNITLQGCNNCTIPNGLENITLTNCTDLLINESNVNYANNGLITSEGAILSFEKVINSADVLTMFTTPIQLIPAVSGYAIQLLSLSTRVVFNTTAYASNTTLNFLTDTANAYQFRSANVLNATLDRTYIGWGNGSSAVAGTTQLIASKDIMITTEGGNPTSGNSNLLIKGTYKIITI